jgi:hypothetical protein
MRGLRDWRLQTAAGLLGGILAVGTPVASAASSAHPQTAAGAHSLLTGPVSAAPAKGTPALATTSTTEQVRQIVQCGNTMYAVGTFTEISQGGVTFPRNNIFSFSALSPYKITSWDPSVSGTVDSIALTPGCADAYIGGRFTAVGSTKVNNIAEIDTTTGGVVTGFGHSANGEVDTLLLTSSGHLLTGGAFKTINGSSANPFYASLSPNTGKDDGYLSLHISGNYVYPGVVPNVTSIYNQQLSPLGDSVLVEGTFTSVGGQSRQQIFMLGLGSASGTVTGWDSPDFHTFCGTKHPFYIKAAAWSPDESTVYIATTGKAPFQWNGKFPLTGICDVVAAYPSTHGQVSQKWANYTGCDSLFSVAADTSAVYVGGHERWADNQNGCNINGPGSIPAPGMGGFTPGPAGGTLLLNSAGTAGRYKRARGEGADDMLVTSAGLWIASDNFGGANTCGGVSGHAGICFLQYP